MNRRELLATLAAATAATLAGCGASPIPLPPGDLAGASADFGHTLRGATLTAPPPNAPTQDVDVLIVGGGIAGLSAAWRLMRAGLKNILLLELEPVAGGTSRSGANKVSAFPWGGHYVPVPMKENQPLIELFDDMGLLEGRDSSGEPIVAEQYLCRDPQERLFHGGKWNEGLYPHQNASSEDMSQFRAFKEELHRWAGWHDSKGRRAFSIPIATSSDDPEVTQLDQISLAEYLDRKAWTSPRLRWYLDYACRDDHATRLETTSAWAGLFYFVSRIRKPGDDAQPLITFPEGNGRFVAHLQKAVAEKIRTGVAVSEISFAEGNDVYPLRVTAITPPIPPNSTPSAILYRAKRVIFAAPQFVARHVIADYKSAPPPHIQSFNYGAWMVANLTLKDRPKETAFPLCWDNVFYDSDSVGYVVATHQRGIDRGPTVLTYYYPLCDADPKDARTRLLAGGRDAWAQFALNDIARAHPDIHALVERIDVMRWGHAMIQPRPGFMWGDARRIAAQPYRGIHFAHSDLSGIALFEEAFYHGIRAANKVMVTNTQGLPADPLR